MLARARAQLVNKANNDPTTTPSAKGDLKDFHSIRINDQWRVIFMWIDGEPYEVRIVDYH
jgi:toxin HigB-1